MVILNSAAQIKDQVTLVDLLARLGYTAKHRSGNELFFISMLREERTASFCVNEQLGVWYDHGGANISGIKGGDIFDFALAFWYPSPFKDILEKIANLMSIPFSEYTALERPKKRPRITGEKISNYQIDTIKLLNTNPAVTRYIKSRGIWDVAQAHMKEVYYSIKSGPKVGRCFFSAGWLNDSGGWELRNRLGERDFKACLGKKAITTIAGSTDTLSIFEGFLDFLSWKVDNPEATDTVIVLNSVNLLDAALAKTETFPTVNVYFDRDKAGDLAFAHLLKAVPHAIDRSSVYATYKDYNEMLMSRSTLSHFYEEEHIYQKVMATYRR